MRKTIIFLIFLLIQGNSIWAEGIWSVNGYQLSNVNILHKLNTVHVNGRIQGGYGADYLKIRILVSNDNGFRGWAETSLQHYSGKGELFESQFKYYPKARLWNIEKIEVTGNDINGMQNNRIEKLKNEPISNNVKPVDSKYEEIIYLSNNRHKAKSFPIKQTMPTKKSKVLFTSFSYISITIKDRKTNKIIMLRNVSPHNLEEIDMAKGSYTASIVGDGPKKEHNFEIKEDSEVINLN